MLLFSVSLKELNEKIRYLGQYYVTKKVNAEFLSSDNKRVFSQEHEGELEKYKKAAEYLKKTYGDQKFPTMKILKDERGKIEEKMASFNKQKNEVKKQSGTISTVLDNVYNITEQERGRISHIETTSKEGVRS